MISDRVLWQRARPLFDELADMEHAARQRRLEEIGREDPVLRDAVQQLLAADREADSALRGFSFASPRETAASDVNLRDPLGVVGRSVSHFRVTEFLAAGGMGVVYAAEDLQLRRTVALKFPLPHQPMGRAVQERFVNEARSAAALDHPNLCTVYEIGESEQGVFLAMPLYPGETLKEHLERNRPLDPTAALDIAAQVTTGLSSAHAAGIVHRDLKPGNVMLLPDGTAKILDFGLAKIRDVDLTKSLMTLGTIGYVAPEQARGARVDARADLWAIGVMLYEMLTGVLPFTGDHEMAVLHAVLHEEPARPSTVNAQLPTSFDDVIGALLQKEPRDRYQSADALLVDLAALERGAPLALPTPFWSRTARRRGIRRAMLPAAALGLVVAAGASWDITRRRTVASHVDQSAEAASPGPEWVGDTAEVGSGAELAAVLAPANAGRHVRLRPGVFEIDRPLVVPDGMTIEGAGVMRYTSDGLPAGFEEQTRTTLRMTASTGGDVLSLGNGVTLRNVEIVDLDGRSGNVVSVLSRRARDSVSVALVNVVVVNPHPLTLGPSGPLGRGLAVLTLNPNMGAEPAPHEGSVLSVRLTRSVIQSPVGGGGFFAYNFAAESKISLDISRSVIGGSNEANGGVSRPDLVHDSEVRVSSSGNLYRNEWEEPCASALLGWNLTGGSGAPIPIPLPATTRNRLRYRSVDDRIEGFTTAVLATGSRRFFGAPRNAAPTENHIDLQLIGTTIATPSCGGPGTSGNTMGLPVAKLQDVADLRLIGAWVENDGIDAGHRNTVRVELRGVRGSGRRFNQFADAAGSTGDLPTQRKGSGNRLEIVGDPQTFSRVNRAVDPAPESGFFSSGRPGPH